jgi:hypothetical protein
MEYLEYATNFDDIGKKEPAHEYTVECPKCKGHGKWNLRLNAYGDGVHFQMGCGQCWGWGFVTPGPDAECIHEFKETTPDQPWRCWHTIKCAKCGRIRSYSSDD